MNRSKNTGSRCGSRIAKGGAVWCLPQVSCRVHNSGWQDRRSRRKQREIVRSSETGSKVCPWVKWQMPSGEWGDWPKVRGATVKGRTGRTRCTPTGRVHCEWAVGACGFGGGPCAYTWTVELIRCCLLGVLPHPLERWATVTPSDYTSLSLETRWSGRRKTGLRVGETEGD